MKYFIIIIGLLFISSCADNNPYNCEMDEQVLHFNDSILEIPDIIDHYVDVMIDYNEADLRNSATKSFRLTIHYSFERKTWIYTLVQTDKGANLTVKKYYTDDYKESKGINDTIVTRDLGTDKWLEIEKAFDANCFWTLKTTEAERGLDGRTCILEAFDPDATNPVYREYFIASRWSPERGTQFYNICHAIEELESNE
ncbi:hypothetical protein K6119_09455 [Paracrocinitomix mangrovi]|uniref:hypothetical protein n=1 Tax=Paracrocinitomix mangrovi TaxID=2862509 RepID=UPI001C8D5694|nr:hypothetical protein [Paracrocinitomix mangrovi]UKN03716.1 hypothetical protein K6119_09455 [Paracrocinitomix mangrovi]